MAHNGSIYSPSSQFPLNLCTHPGCEFRTNSRSTLKDHLCSHSSDRRYVCKFKGCGSTFKYRSGRSIHQRKKHKGKIITGKYERKINDNCRPKIAEKKEDRTHANMEDKKKEKSEKNKKETKEETLISATQSLPPRKRDPYRMKRINWMSRSLD